MFAPKENTMKKFTCFIIITALMLSVFSFNALAAENAAVHVVADNEVIAFPDAQPMVDEKGNALVPLYFVAQKLGAEVTWNESENSVTVKHLEDTIIIKFPNSGSASVTLNNETVSTDIAPFIKDDRTYVSLKFLTDLLHYKTTWNSGIGTALVMLPEYSGESTGTATDVTTSEVIKLKSFDGYELSGKLDLPKGYQEVPTLVVFVPGTGPNTYDNHRLINNIEFNYYDLFAQELGIRGAAFFRYNTRGVEAGDEAPTYTKVNKEEYKKYTPENQAKDIEAMITELKKNEKLKNARVVLLGWSEGTIIAPLVAERGNVEIASLMLAGYCNVKMQDIIEWQLSGDSSMIFYCQYFDTNLDGLITKQEFEADPYGAAKSLGGVEFEQIDINVDNILTSADFAVILTERKKQVLDAISKKDDEWIWNNYFQVTSEWLDGHAKLEANKDRLLKLDVPINIFHGVYDQNVPLRGVYEIYDSCKASGKTNIKAFVFNGHDHDLNYLMYPYYNKISAGLTQIFNECAKVK